MVFYAPVLEFTQRELLAPTYVARLSYADPARRIIGGAAITRQWLTAGDRELADPAFAAVQRHQCMSRRWKFRICFDAALEPGGALPMSLLRFTVPSAAAVPVGFQGYSGEDGWDRFIHWALRDLHGFLKREVTSATEAT